MSHRCIISVVLLAGLLLAGTVTAAPSTKSKPNLRGTDSDVSSDRIFERGAEDEKLRLCADKALAQLPLRSVATSTLALDELAVHVENGYYTVLLPLLETQGDMRLLYWGADTIEEVMTFSRLVQSRKIKALKVEAYLEEFRRDIATPVSEEELQVCSADTIKNFLQPCKNCVIVEWVFEGRVD